MSRRQRDRVRLERLVDQVCDTAIARPVVATAYALDRHANLAYRAIRSVLAAITPARIEEDHCYFANHTDTDDFADPQPTKENPA